ncbi:MarR family winged helix-turn-helix transcriptional regulator [Roseibium aestuarii]|uniref:MarR family winged helix-turn-helix transcriptional regulator n=1 Tax=Roseibium aestuarii TaxID=2600299 RepID=A0ABW4JUJ5_9HYPH|nr:MarR family transcriptional regulator [Roseibium aestuarii]
MTELKQMPGHLIRRYQQIAVAVFHRQVDPLGLDLTPVQFAALNTLRVHKDIDQATLAGLIAYDRTTITGVIDRLTAKGLVDRKISPTDRRARVVSLTAEGEAALDRVMPAVEEAQTVMLQGLDAREQQVFMELLTKATEATNDLSRAPLIPLATPEPTEGAE